MEEQPLNFDPSYIPTVSVTALPAVSPIGEILAVLDRDGGVILTNFISSDELIAIKTETADHEKINTDHVNANIPAQTHLVGGLVGKSPTIAKVCEKPVLTDLRSHILTDYFTDVREGVAQQHITHPLINITVTLNIGHGAPRQRLHRDDNVHGIKHDQPFKLDKAASFGCLVAACDTTRENGATMFVPGSHRWDDVRGPKLDEVCFAEMKQGSALIFLGSAYHGGGHNAVPGSWRTVHGLFFCRGNLRTEENQFLAIPRSTVLGMSNAMKGLLGYKKPIGTVLGIVENKDPMSDLEGFLARASA